MNLFKLSSRSVVTGVSLLSWAQMPTATRSCANNQMADTIKAIMYETIGLCYTSTVN